MTGIYLIKNLVNGEKYIGQSVDIQRRKKEHKYICSESNQSLKRAYNKYGYDKYQFDREGYDYLGFDRVRCDDGWQMRKREDIHEEVYEKIKTKIR